MRNIVSAYVERFLHDRRERLKFGGIVLLLAVIVIGIVFWRLSYVGVAMTNEVNCGMEEHQHDSSCYTETLSCGLEESAGSAGHTHDSSCYETVTELVCGLEESEGHVHSDFCFDEYGNLICAIPESEGHVHDSSCYMTTQILICGQEETPAVAGHTHSSSCYTQVLTCAIPEHTHSMECMIDETADLETAKDWEDTLPEEEDYTGVWAEDVVLVAESQIGYTESEKNFVLDEDGETRRGYTRYGEWYGNAYGDWDAMFVSFCLYYAGVTEEAFPYNAGAYAWIAELNKLEEEDETEELLLYADREEYFPVSGDIIFFDIDGDKKADHVGIVKEIAETEAEEKPDRKSDRDSDEETVIKILTVEGDCDGEVCENEYDPEDEFILGYGILPENPEPVTEESVRSDYVAEDNAAADVAVVYADDADEVDPASAVTYSGVTEQAEETDEAEADGTEYSSDEMEEETAPSDEIDESEDETASDEPEETGSSDASGELEDTYLITYSSNNPEVLEVEGPDSAEAGEDLYFIVTVEDGYEITEAVVNDEVLEPEDITVSNDGLVTVYSYLMADVEEDTVVFLDATQVLNGYGSIEVYEVDSVRKDAEFILEITNAPTNTKISLDSPTITIKYNTDDGLSVDDVSLNGNLYYVVGDDKQLDSEDSESVRVAYLMLDENVMVAGSDPNNPEYENGVYQITAYDENDTPLTGGNLVLNYLGTDRVEIWNIQTNTLCSWDESEGYKQEVIGAETAFDSLIYVLEVWTEDTEVDMGELTKTKDENDENKYKFYYGSAKEEDFSLTEFTEGVVHNGRLVPEVNGKPVDNYGTLYMAYDELYSFDIEITNVSNELTEDNGDTYLWFGGDFYVDQYHQQGTYYRGSTERYAFTTLNNGQITHSGIWVQLGHLREDEINSGSETFSDYKNVSYADALEEGVETTDQIIEYIANTDSENNWQFGIVGPYSIDDGGAYQKTETVRITGHLGDSFTANDVFGTTFVYLIKKDTEKHSEWIDVGAHSSDENGDRSWWYWINNFYVVNNYKDVCEYVTIYENNNGDVRLEAADIGKSGSGEVHDIWDDLEYICTKRESEIQNYIIDNKESLKSEGVGVFDYAGWPMHVQLRLTNTVEVVVNGVIYSGTLSIVTDEGYEPYVDCWFENGYNSKGETTSPVHRYTSLTMDSNGMESSYVELSSNYKYISPDIAFDAEKSIITVTVYATGTLSGSDNTELVYDDNNMLKYEYTLTSEQLKEAYDCCPCHDGYDIALNLGQAVQLDAEKQIILYKVWDDSNNRLGLRDDITSVTVSLERSTEEDSANWDLVRDNAGGTRAFVISGDADSNVWSTVLTSRDLDLTWSDDSGGEGDYVFRISDEQDIVVSKDYGYAIDYDYLIAGTELVIENFLEEFPITIKGTKVWGEYVDDEFITLDPSLIPESITIALYQNDEFYAKTELTEGDDGSWSFIFEEVPQRLVRTTQNEDDGTWNYDYLYTYSLYELDSYGNIVGDGEVIPLDLGSYLVEIELGSSTDEYGDDLDNSNGITGNTEGITFRNVFLVYPVSIYKYTEGENDLVLTYAAWTSGLQYEVEKDDGEAETIDYYLWGIKDTDPDEEGEGTNDPVHVVVTSDSDSDGSYKYSEFLDGSQEAQALTVSPDGTILIEHLPYGYTYYLTTDGEILNTEDATALTLALDSASGAQPLSGAEFIISKTVTSTSDEEASEEPAEEPTETEQTLYAIFDEDGKLVKWTDNIEEATVRTSDEDGYINIKLTTGTYTLTEVKAPSGFNLLIDSIEFEVTSTGATLAVPVENPPGVALPVTGGVGTFWFTLAGLTVAAAAGGALMYRSRKRKGGTQA